MKKIFNSFELKGRMEAGPQATLDAGCGLYTKGIALSIKSKPTIMVGAEMGISGSTDNGIEIGNQKATIDVYVDVQADGRVEVLGKEFFHKDYTIAKWNLFNGEWPIFPILKPNSFNITYHGGSANIHYGGRANSRGYSPTRNEEPSNTFLATLAMDGGEMTKIMGGRPAIIVKKDGKEVLREVGSMGNSEETYQTFHLTGLEQDVKYTAVPCILVNNQVYHWNPKDFSVSTRFCPDDNHPHMIDLGLPSGAKWSCCNLGADNPLAYGNLYAFGETEVKDKYTVENYQHLLWYSPNLPVNLDSYYPYNKHSYEYLFKDNNGYWTAYKYLDVKNNSISGTNYDAAHVNWGGTWCMPTYDQCKELIENCSYDIVYSSQEHYHKQIGIVLIGSNGNKLFCHTRSNDDDLTGWWTPIKYYEKDGYGQYFEPCIDINHKLSFVYNQAKVYSGYYIRPVSK